MEQLSNSDGYVLGLDVGMASVGAALLSDQHILALHVRTFDKAETADKGESLNSIRRAARSARRRLRRRAYRLLRLQHLLRDEGLVNPCEVNSWAVGASPWTLRAEGLDRKLTIPEWAAVLYHLVKHRGFQSTRKSEAESDERVGEMLSGVGANQQRMQEKGWRTAGEMAARDPVFATAKRNKGGSYSHTFSRTDLEDELGKLFDAQRRLGNSNAGSAFEHRVHKLLMARRPALSGENLLKMVGTCTFEKGEYRAPKASYSAERFVWLTKLNNLRVGPPGDLRPLSDGERNLLIDLPFKQSRLTYRQVRTTLDLPLQFRFNGLNYSRKKGDDDEVSAESSALFEAKAFHKLRKAYEQNGLKHQWQRDALNPEKLDRLAWAQTVFKEDTEARTWLVGEGIEEAIINAVLGVSFDKFQNLSLKALRKLLPHMEAGLRYDEAVLAAGYEHHSRPVSLAKAPMLPPISRDDFSNPVVCRALNQARKLVNAIVREYGPPSRVHIELARDLSKPFDERRRIEREQKEFRDSKEEAVSDFVDRFGWEPRGEQLTKWRLYREQDGKCAYSMHELVLGRLFEDGYAEIDHALPYSRSFDDGMSNKVLVLTAQNRDKGDRTPYEYLGGIDDSEAWRHFQAFVLANPKYRKAKRDVLLRKDFSSTAAEGFRERNLSDTRYIARAFKTMVETHLQLADDSDRKRCVVVSGQLTAFLRHRWGLNKNRDAGDKHHALDAAVVAACSDAMVKRLADYSRRGELEHVRGPIFDHETGEVLNLEGLRRTESQFPVPWRNFRRELLARLSDTPAVELAKIEDYPPSLASAAVAIRVSRAPRRRGTGQAHQETIRSGKLLGQGQSTVKTPLTKLRLKDVERIVGYQDPRNADLIRAIVQRLEAFQGDGAKAFKEPFYKPSKPGRSAPIVRTVNLCEVQKSGFAVRGGIVNNGDIMRADIFTDGKRFYAIPLYVSDAVKAALPNLAVVAHKSEDEWTAMDETLGYRFLFSLHPNDWVRVRQKGKPVIEGYFGAVSRSSGTLDIWVHDRDRRVGRKGREGLMEGVGIKTALSVEKFHVDMLGRCYPARQEVRAPLNYRGSKTLPG